MKKTVVKEGDVLVVKNTEVKDGNGFDGLGGDKVIEGCGDGILIVDLNNKEEIEKGFNQLKDKMEGVIVFVGGFDDCVKYCRERGHEVVDVSKGGSVIVLGDGDRVVRSEDDVETAASSLDMVMDVPIMKGYKEVKEKFGEGSAMFDELVAISFRFAEIELDDERESYARGVARRAKMKIEGILKEVGFPSQYKIISESERSKDYDGFGEGKSDVVKEGEEDEKDNEDEDESSGDGSGYSNV